MIAKIRSALLLFVMAIQILEPVTADAACYITCQCTDRKGYGSSRSYGPFYSTPACNAAVNNFTMQCKSGNQAHWFTATCSPGCYNCEPPTPPKSSPVKKTVPAPGAAKQTNWDEVRRTEALNEQRQFQLDLDSLKQKMKGGTETGGAGEMRLKSPPSENALQQLRSTDGQSRSGSMEEHGKDLIHSSSGASALPGVPSVPAPAAVERDGRLPQAQVELLQRISTTRQKLVQQDNEIVQLEKAVQIEEAQPPELKIDEQAGDSAALAKARQALAKAKADRARTAAELTKLEKQETADKAEPR